MDTIGVTTGGAVSSPDSGIGAGFGAVLEGTVGSPGEAIVSLVRWL